MADIKNYGPVYGTDAYGNPLSPHTLAAVSPNPVRGEPIPLTNPVAQWQEKSAPEKGPSTFPDQQRNQLHETRRSQFAGQILASLVMHSGANASESNLQRMAQLAVRGAELLLIELEKPTR